MRMFDEVSYDGGYDPGPVYYPEPVYAPAPEQAYYGLPYFPEPTPAPTPPQAKYGLPYFPSYETSPYIPPIEPGVSRVGPTPSVQPRGPIDRGLPAGSMLAGLRASFFGGGGGHAPSRSPGAISRQRSFTVDLQERLRKRRRNRFMR